MNHVHLYTRAVHHTDSDGKHYCPTGFMYCDAYPDCDVWGIESEPFQCTVWDRVPDQAVLVHQAEHLVANEEADGSSPSHRTRA